ncbi:unnamed protein product (macronuclear) [Paramecium tetraurelia]|uniref:Transmembrane protein n=1 Tax=Paramecium tetraurelia TaxID=5888 RepID=A0CGN2_PARTE|nr:uncharacterized protein GSPATT00007389001 [Paramecium tetraurelia]CAK69949.1 unnamed protein product [Paramecium tetraurelia]|eukprot:XP_001437346.1 hypothetical protein (macronuclear) [Paramecium tetraurelia strain d4-2]
MELEKQIYKFHYFLTSWKYARVSAKSLFLGLLGISLLCIAVYVSLCVRQGERRLEFLQQDNSVISQFNETVVYTVNIVDHSNSDPLLQMRFSFNRYLLSLRQNIAKDHNITQEILFVDSNNYQSNFDLFFLNFVDIETMFLVDFTNYFTDSEHDILIQNLKTREMWYWGKNSLKNDESTSLYIKMIRNIFLCQQILVSLFFVSCTSSIIIRLFMLSVPAFSYIIRSSLQRIFRQEQELNNQGNQENWIGIYIRLLERNNKVKYYIVFAFLTMIFFYTVIYNQGMDQATYFMFGKSIPQGLNIYFMMQNSLTYQNSIYK